MTQPSIESKRMAKWMNSLSEMALSVIDSFLVSVWHGYLMMIIGLIGLMLSAFCFFWKPSLMNSPALAFLFAICIIIGLMQRVFVAIRSFLASFDEFQHYFMGGMKP